MDDPILMTDEDILKRAWAYQRDYPVRFGRGAPLRVVVPLMTIVPGAPDMAEVDFTKSPPTVRRFVCPEIPNAG